MTIPNREKILNFWKEKVTKEVESSHYNFTKDSQWVRTPAEINRILSNLKTTSDGEEVRKDLRNLFRKKAPLIWASKPFILYGFLKDSDFTKLIEFKNIIVSIKETKDFNEAWIDQMYKLVHDFNPIGTEKLKGSKAFFTNIIGELFGHLHINEYPVWNSCSRGVLHLLGYTFQNNYDSFRNAYDSFKTDYLNQIGKITPDYIPINTEIDEFFNFFDKDKEARQFLTSKGHSSNGTDGVEVQKYAFLWSAIIEEDKSVIKYHRKQIERKGLTYWATGFRVKVEKITFPIKGYLYTTDNGKVTYRAKIEGIETYDTKQMPKEPELRPPEYKDELWKTYLKLSELEPLPVPKNVKDFTKWDGAKVEGPVRNYVLILDQVAATSLYTVDDFVKETGFTQDEIKDWSQLLKRKKQIILQGPPGTGKTFVALRLAKLMTSGTYGFWDIVQFHPDYAYEDFIQGYRPEPKNGTLNFELEPGRFLKFCGKAGKANGAPCVLVIDEINRANLSRVFGELMYLLEYRDRKASLAAGGEPFSIPENVYLIGTMNTADRSIALVDYALRRRFSFIRLKPEYDILASQLKNNKLPSDSLIKVLQEINQAIDNPNYEVGISPFIENGEHLKEVLPSIWKSEIEPNLEEYFYDQRAKVQSFRWDNLVKDKLKDWVQ